jgi:hypothetical protein
VAHHHHREAVPAGQVLEKAGDLHLVLDVQVGGGLVQQKDVRVLDEASRYHHLLALSGRELCERAERQVLYIEFLEYGVRRLQIVSGRADSAIGVAPHDDHVYHAQGEVGRRGVRDVPHHPGQLLQPVLGHVPSIDHDASAGGGQQLVEAMQEGRLAHSVRADNGYDFPLAEPEGDGFQDSLVLVGEGQVRGLDLHADWMHYPI